MEVRTITRGQHFLCKKWTLFSFTILASIVILAITTVYSVFEHNLGHDKTRNRNVAICIIAGVVALVIQIIGMIGSVKEKYYMLLTYSILMAMSTGGLVACAIYIPIYWLFVLISGLFSFMAYLFAKEVHLLRLEPPQFDYGQTNPGYMGFLYPSHESIPGNMFHSSTAQPFAAHNIQQGAPGVAYAGPGNFHYSTEAPPPYSAEPETTTKMQDIDLSV